MSSQLRIIVTGLLTQYPLGGVTWDYFQYVLGLAQLGHDVYYFEDTASPSLVWIRLNQIDFQPGSGVRQVTLHGNPGLGGDQTTNFKKAEAFKFLAPH